MPATSSTTTVLALRSASGGVGPGAEQVLVDLLQPLPGGLDRPVEARVRHEIRERIADHVARDFAVAMAAEPVGDRPQPDLRPFDECVLVDLARQADVARGGRSEADRRRRSPSGISRVAPVSTRAETGRQRYCAQVPSSNATNVSGCGRPFAIRQLGSTADDPSVHHNTSGSYIDDKRCDNSCSNTGASSAGEPIGICHDWRAVAQHRRRGRVEHDPRRQGDRFERLAQLDDLLVEALEIDVLRRQRLDDQPLGAIEKRRGRRRWRRSD